MQSVYTIENSGDDSDKQANITGYAVAEESPIVVDDNNEVESENDILSKLDTRIVDALNQMKITTLLPIQVLSSSSLCLLIQLRVIPHVLSGVDVSVFSPTGSGKTLSYAIPIVQALIDRVLPRLRALVIVPTQELALQVRDVFCMLCINTTLVVAAATAQGSFQVFKHFKKNWFLTPL